MDPTIAAQWAPKGCQPQLFSDSNRERVNLCGFVNAKTRDSLVQRIPKGNAQSFISFLQWVTSLYATYSKIWLYVDNAKWHRSKDVKDYLAQQEHIALQFFPPYSPELNPMEWEWHELRRQATHTKRFQCNKECWQTIQNHFETRKGKNNHFICQLN
ncbi:MAG TPA: IS630 family transposase [Candidatus Brocadiaceae bacterium]